MNLRTRHLAAAGLAALGLLATTLPAQAAPTPAADNPAAAEEPTITIYNNGWGYAYFLRNGDKLQVCDTNRDGLKVRVSVQKWYQSMQTWQAVGSGSAPSFDSPYGRCDRYTINVEPDSSLIRLHMWGEDSDGVARKQDYSPSGHA